MERKRIPKENKVRAILQQEINSTCPFCNSTEVGHFQIHHIDDNPSNNAVNNLLLVCPTCHSKITKCDIAKDAVKNKKEELMKNINKNQKTSAKIIYNNNSTLEEDYTFDSKIGYYKHNRTGKLYCAKCLLKNIPAQLIEFDNHWRCSNCGEWYTKPGYNPFPTNSQVDDKPSDPDLKF